MLASRCSPVLECYIPRPAPRSPPPAPPSPLTSPRVSSRPLLYPSLTHLSLLQHHLYPLPSPRLTLSRGSAFLDPLPHPPSVPASSLHSMRVETLIIPLRVLQLPPSAPQVILHPLQSSLFSLQVILSLAPSHPRSLPPALPNSDLEGGRQRVSQASRAVWLILTPCLPKSTPPKPSSPSLSPCPAPAPPRHNPPPYRFSPLSLHPPGPLLCPSTL